MDDSFDDELELYLDDALDATRRAAFEARLARDAELRRRVELQRALDASLRNAFRPPAEVRLPTNGDALERVAIVDCLPPRKMRHGRLWTIAAAALVALAAWTWVEWAVRPEPIVAERPPRGPAADAACQQVRAEWTDVYESVAQGGVACSTVSWSETLHGRRLSLEGGEALIHGRIVDPRLGPDATGFAALVGASPTLVCVSPAERDPGPLVGREEGLFLFRRELAGLVLYELTPLAEPGVLPHLVAGP